MKTLLLFFFSLIILFSQKGKAQDIHFSQFFTSPLLLNPANTGFFNCDYRFTANYRSQWHSVTVPYNTFAASGDLRLVKGKNGKDLLGVGTVLSADKAGDSQFSTTQGGIALAYNYNLDRFGIQYFGGGLLLSYNSSTINYSALKFSTPEPNFFATSLNYVDLSAGLAWHYIPDHENNFSFGGSVYHINNPRKSFFANNLSRLPTKYVLNMDMELRATNRVEFYPKAMFEVQGGNQELVFGSSARAKLGKLSDSRYGMYLGLWYRWNDAAIIFTRFDIDNLSFSFSYDMNVSQLREVSEIKGGPELSVIYIGCIPSFSRKTVYCPRF